MPFSQENAGVAFLAFLVADVVFSSDYLAGGGPAAAHFLWSRPKISKQRKVTATASPLRGSRRCGGLYKRLAAHCAIRAHSPEVLLSVTINHHRQTAVLRQQRNAQRAVGSDPLRAGPVMCCGKWIRGAHV